MMGYCVLSVGDVVGVANGVGQGKGRGKRLHVFLDKVDDGLGFIDEM